VAAATGSAVSAPAPFLAGTNGLTAPPLPASGPGWPLPPLPPGHALLSGAPPADGASPVPVFPWAGNGPVVNYAQAVPPLAGPYYPLPGSMPPPVLPPKRRRGPLVIFLGLLAVLLVGGGVLLGLGLGRLNSGSAPAQATAIPTVIATASPTPQPQQLYQQVTSQKPTFTDSLQNASSSLWAVAQHPTYGCKIKSDGLHVYVKDAHHYYYCSSGHGSLMNFAFQVEMKMLSGSGGGIVFRVNAVLGSYYYFHIYPDGVFHMYITKNHKLGAELGAGNSGTFASGLGQKNTLTVIAQGSLFLFYVNKQFIYKVQDTNYSSGYLGVMADDDTSPAETLYTNAQIWLL
jgi:hypothetical protein